MRLFQIGKYLNRGVEVFHNFSADATELGTPPPLDPGIYLETQFDCRNVRVNDLPEPTGLYSIGIPFAFKICRQAKHRYAMGESLVYCPVSTVAYNEVYIGHHGEAINEWLADGVPEIETALTIAR